MDRAEKAFALPASADSAAELPDRLDKVLALSATAERADALSALAELRCEPSWNADWAADWSAAELLARLRNAAAFCAIRPDATWTL